MSNPINILKQYWGYDQFRNVQEEVIQIVLKNQDTLALMPTGGGKSICYQVPALLNDGICIVISPLIALMKDQVSQLTSRGIKAMTINAQMSRKQIDIALDNCIYGNYKFLIISPERLQSDLFRTRFEKMPVSLITVDEAHCISEWGYDFRPAYLQIARIRELKPNIPILALTASATKAVKEDIIEYLQFSNHRVISGDFARPHLSYNVLDEGDKRAALLETIHRDVSGIVYVNTRKAAKEVARFLNHNDVSAAYYHGGMKHDERNKVQDQWINNHTNFVVATNAFGMGIDKPDVRQVIHWNIPDSIEAYYQEAGRAGRDGQPSTAIILHNQHDIQDVMTSVERAFPPIETIKEIYQNLANYFQIPIGGITETAVPFYIQEFCERYEVKPLTVFNALKILESEGYLVLSHGLRHASKVKILVQHHALKSLTIPADTKVVLEALLRSYGSLFDQYTIIKEEALAAAMNKGVSYVEKELQKLAQLEVLSYEKRTNAPTITYLRERVSQQNFSITHATYNRRKEVKMQKAKAMIGYVENTENCRALQLTEYLDQAIEKPCGVCDVCQNAQNTTSPPLLRKQIAASITSQPQTLREIIQLFPGGTKDEIIEALRWMVDEGEIRKGEDKKYYMSGN